MSNLITTIEGIVEINQAKRERRIERAIATASIGVGTASVSASSMANYAQDILPEIAATQTTTESDPPPTIHPGVTTTFVFILSCAIAAYSPAELLGWA